MIIVFTGSKKGITDKQITSLIDLIKNGTEFHHGGCVGGDTTFHLLIPPNTETKIIVHPGDDKQYKTFNIDIKTWKVLKPKPYLERNKDMVDELQNKEDWLIACPHTHKEILRSGTWATIRYARKTKKKIIIIYPDGICDMEK